MTVDQRMVERVKKLFALGSGEANEHEAAAAMNRAHDLMKCHGIAMVDLDGGEQLGVDGWSSEWKSQVDTYSRILASATSKLFNCKQWMITSGKAFKYRVKMCFAGEDTDLALTVNVWPFLVKFAKRAANHYAGPGWTPSHRSFCESFSYRVLARAKKIAEDDKETVTQDDAKYALIVVSKEDAIQKWFEEKGIKLTARKSIQRGEVDHYAALAGAAAGDRIPLGFKGQVTGVGEKPKHIE